MQRFRYVLIVVLSVAVVFLLSIVSCPAATICNSGDWLDNDSNFIGAHEGGISRFDPNGPFYWYGCYKNDPQGRYATSGLVQFHGFAVYSSNDLATWQYEGMALPVPSRGFLAANYPAHRLHVIYNDTTGKYVTWFFRAHQYPGQVLMVADANSPTGPFELRGVRETGGPYGFGQDMNLFKDDDGTAYLVYDDGLRNIRIDKLSSDYLSSTRQSVVAIDAASRGNHESPVMVKYKGKYIVAGSGVEGWAGSETYYAVADNPLGPYTYKGDITVGTSDTWCSQITDLVYISDNNSVMAMTDVWCDPGSSDDCRADCNDFNQSKYYFLPVSFDPITETATMSWQDCWDPLAP